MTPRCGCCWRCWRFSAFWVVAAAAAIDYPGPNGLYQTPPMGWMSWERFRCEINCEAEPDACIDEALYMAMADRIAADGYLAAGYDTVSIDDCWEATSRDAAGKLAPNSTRFPSGFAALGEYIHSLNVSFGIYSDEGTSTCGGYPGSEGYETIDAQTFADWGVDYLKLDGCYNDVDGYETGYPAMGAALQATGRAIGYSCSWPAYLGDNETAKPFDRMVASGCNLWRNWDDINNSWDSVQSIIDHWGDYGDALAAAAGPGHWNDPDMVLVGDDHYGSFLTPDQARAQMSIWSIAAAPLIMSNDLRTVPDEYKTILLNAEVIAVDQDPLGSAGKRVSPKGEAEVWARPLDGGDVAVALFNRDSNSTGASTPISFTFDEVGFTATAASVRDLWEGLTVDAHAEGFYMAMAVPAQGVTLLRLTAINSA